MSEGHDGEHVHPESGEELSVYARRAQAIEALMVEKGVCSTSEVDQMMNMVESRSPSDGAKVVAHAWSDPEFKARLLADPRSALTEIGYSLPDTTPHLAVVENTEQVHHMVVCTLCPLTRIHISERTRPLYISYVVFCLKKKNPACSFNQLYKIITLIQTPFSWTPTFQL
mgnify:CR=1 FL=1